MTDVAQELERRRSRADECERLFRSRPNVWITATELATVGGFCAWRTRVADVRHRVRTNGEGTIEWNRRVRESAYRFVVGSGAPAPPVIAAEGPQPRLF